MRNIVTISLNPKILANLDEYRGEISRSAMIKIAILDYLNKKGGTSSKKRTSRGSKK